MAVPDLGSAPELSLKVASSPGRWRKAELLPPLANATSDEECLKIPAWFILLFRKHYTGSNICMGI